MTVSVRWVQAKLLGGFPRWNASGRCAGSEAAEDFMKQSSGPRVIFSSVNLFMQYWLTHMGVKKKKKKKACRSPNPCDLQWHILYITSTPGQKCTRGRPEWCILEKESYFSSCFFTVCLAPGWNVLNCAIVGHPTDVNVKQISIFFFRDNLQNPGVEKQRSKNEQDLQKSSQRGQA